ncbi:MAG: Maf family protein [Flavobacteriales bacterium]
MDEKMRVPIISKIHGSYFNVMGLPIAELWDELKNL